ncbi:hypothetical protein ASO20_02590 [Mycoplasma sp. (ex Biomphalaria glabrata)]|uniref:class II fructose-bisphosphate aldolase n=1 Tax=Mycoplasma sp. (ex Biomphalaria glabrata) TaxID=1749074 RepID=UPI00073A6186|nr:ketose-bisphosphate aldolase [Mycoplasma sp. (ex Biomphalaria glabrata)]ALV23523.1 hypothetical protein ASO20_02590 [Mycoplasma sp. (ex Biomphalaria glabrata)]
MLCNTKKMILDAQKHGYAVPAFNIHNLENARACVEAAVEMKSPLILACTPSTFSFSGLEAVVGLVEGLQKQYPMIPIALHMDHHHTYEEIELGLKAGIRSVMIDGSSKSLQENIEYTKKVVTLAKKYDATVEAELGAIPGVEDDLIVNHVLKDDPCTTPVAVKEFTEKTEVDSIAVAIGNAHGIYITKPVLNVARLKEIRKIVDTPLVLHGGSGLTLDQVRDCIKNGVAKFNVGTELKKPYISGIIEHYKKCNTNDYEDSKLNDPRYFLKDAINNIKKVAKEKIEMCMSNNRC